MFLLFETIACENGQLKNLKWHTIRLNNSRKDLFGCKDHVSLEMIKIPSFAETDKWKCRVLYNKAISVISFEPYTPRNIKTIRLVESEISYQYKYEERTELDDLFKMRDGADEILLIKNGMATDTSIANLLLFDGHEWITPDTPLLEGTMRAFLIEQGSIKIKPVRKIDLFSYKKLMLINALNPFDESRAIELPSAILL